MQLYGHLGNIPDHIADQFSVLVIALADYVQQFHIALPPLASSYGYIGSDAQLDFLAHIGDEGIHITLNQLALDILNTPEMGLAFFQAHIPGSLFQVSPATPQQHRIVPSIRVPSSRAASMQAPITAHPRPLFTSTSHTASGPRADPAPSISPTVPFTPRRRPASPSFNTSPPSRRVRPFSSNDNSQQPSPPYHPPPPVDAATTAGVFGPVPQEQGLEEQGLPHEPPVRPVQSVRPRRRRGHRYTRRGSPS